MSRTWKDSKFSPKKKRIREQGSWCYYFGYYSDRLNSKIERSRAKRDLLNGIEPAKRYYSGKNWKD